MIEIVEYRPTWPAEFAAIAAGLGQTLGKAALRIDHIGSTSVPELCAKDIIDIQITVLQLDGPIITSLLAAGFARHAEIVQDHVPPGRAGAQDDWIKLFFTQPPGQRRTNIHVRQTGRPNQRYALLFRDFLRANRATSEAYGQLKRRLASSLTDPGLYPDVKDPAVDLIYFAAEQWALQSGWQVPA